MKADMTTRQYAYLCQTTIAHAQYVTFALPPLTVDYTKFKGCRVRSSSEKWKITMQTITIYVFRFFKETV
jgi:hypothetical protein